MANDHQKLQAIISHCKEYGFIFPSSEIYDGLSAVYDYGQYGSELKKNIRDYWWKTMTQLQDNIVGIDAAIFMHPTTWKACGHVDNFSDPMIDNKDSQKRYRVDHLIEAHADELEAAGKKDQADALIATMEALLAKSDFEALKALIEEKKSDVRSAVRLIGVMSVSSISCFPPSWEVFPKKPAKSISDRKLHRAYLLIF